LALEPSVAVGDVLNATDELAQWIEVKDWIHDGDWWINLALPPQIMPYVPAGQPDRYAKAGSYADYLMRNFLKKHTFLVNVKTIDFKNLQNFEQLSSIINEVKPSWTYPIYIWTVPLVDENFNMDDSLFFLRWDQFKCDNITVPIGKFTRLNAIFPDLTASTSKPIALAQNDDILVSNRATTYRNAIPPMPITGEVFWEVTIDKIATSGEVAIGIGLSTTDKYAPAGSTADAYVYLNSGQKRNNASTGAYGAAYVGGDVIGVQYNASTGALTFYKNGVSQGTAYTGIVGTYYPLLGELGGDGAYYASPNATGNYISTPDAVANRLTGDIDIRARIYLEDWAGGTVQSIIAKEDGTLRWQFTVTATGALGFVTQTLTATSSVVTGYAKRTANWVRVTRATATGSVDFFTSVDGLTWTPLGTTQATTAGNLVGTAGANVYVAYRPVTSQQNLFGRVHCLAVRNGINGTPVMRVEPGQLSIGGVLSIGSDTGETWTITRNRTYLSLPGSTGNYASTTDSLKTSITQDIDIQVDLALTSWASGSTQTIFAKHITTGNQKSFFLNITTIGKIEFGISADGSSTTSVLSDASTGFGGGSENWVRITRTFSDGVVTFFTSADGITWTPFGTTKILLAGQMIFDSTAITQIGGIDGAGTQFPTGKFYKVNMIGNGATVLMFNPNRDSNIGNTSVLSSLTGETWIINQQGSPSPVAILTTDIIQGKFLVLYQNPGSATRTGARFNFGNYQFSFAAPSTATPGLYTVGASLTRGCPQFTRSTISQYTNQQLGNDSQINAKPLSFEGGVVSGYVDSIHQLRRNSGKEIGWVRAVVDRNAECYRKPRGVMMFQRGEAVIDGTGIGVRGFPQPDVQQRIVYLYTTVQADIQDKFTGIGGQVPGLDKWAFTLFQPFRTATSIDVTPIDQDFVSNNFFSVLQATYSSFFFPSPSFKYLGNFMPSVAYRTYAPQLSDVQPNDYLLFIRIYENTLAVYWVTSNLALDIPGTQMVENTDQFDANSQNATIKHGLCYYSSYYLLRGAGSSLTYSTGGPVDAASIDAGLGSTSTSISRTYSDDENPTPVTVDHSGVVLKFRRDFK
jgi:hypothetical protein